MCSGGRSQAPGRRVEIRVIQRVEHLKAKLEAKESENRGIGKLLNSEASQSAKPRPRPALRPASPRRFAGLGAAKQESVMKSVGVPVLAGLPQPGRFIRSGKTWAMLLFNPGASPTIVGVKGSPEESCSIVPSCQSYKPRERFPTASRTRNSHVPLCQYDRSPAYLMRVGTVHIVRQASF